MNVKNRTIFTGDNLPIMRGLETESVDLIYLDPPFNKNRIFQAPIGSPAEGAAFRDIWTLEDIDIAWHEEIEAKNRKLWTAVLAGDVHSKSMKSYLVAMSVRLLEIHRVLKPTGSLYYHCDPTASHYIKLLLDAIFGPKNYRSEIVWHYHMGHSPRRDFRRKHDIIFRYSKTNDYLPVQIRVPRRMAMSRYNRVDENGRQYHENGMGKRFYADDGIIPDDVWSYLADKSFTQLNSQAKERVGYPTQKPLALLERIIKASSNEGDVVLDPFCGCATTCIAAERLQRRWIGIDISEKANQLMQQRMVNDLGLFGLETIHRTDLPKRKGHRSKNIKNVLYGKQEGYCNGCRTHFQVQNLEIDHIVPSKLGGLDDDENLQLLCGHCNRLKGTKTMHELKARLNAQRFQSVSQE